MEWLKKLFGLDKCAACKVYAESTQRIMEYHRNYTHSLQSEIEDLKDQRDKLQEVLFRVARLAPTHTPEKVTQSTSLADRVGFKGSKRNWNDVRSELERQHRKSTTDDEAKLAEWQKVNAKAEKEIPELAEVLAARAKADEQKSDVDILAEV